MYQYTDFDKQFVKLRAQQFRDQLERWQKGELSDEQMLPLRLQNGWYIQRYAPMARIAVPYGEISSLQLRTLGHIAREYDRPSPELLASAQATQDALEASQPGATLAAPALQYGYGHFTTRTNCQFNWIPITRAADVMDLLASVSMHGIQTSGNDIRNITCDAWEGIAQDSIVDCRPFAEITRQWSSLHPEFSYLPRKFKIA
ncbi:MAG: nitrite/sulfite reductase, partial [Alicycliphilus sp.]